MSDSPPGGAGSINSHDGDQKQGEKKKSRRPANTAFRQQRLKAWQPILTPKTVLPLFFTIGIIFAPIGGLLLYASSQVQELRLDYTHCSTQAPIVNSFGSPDAKSMEAKYVKTAFKGGNSQVNARWSRLEGQAVQYKQPGGQNFGGVVSNTTQCVIDFTLPERFTPPVLFYYQLTNFYQNHRRYVASFSDKQLKGNDVGAGEINGSACDPLRWSEEFQKPYYPCGLIANSMFNDTFSTPIFLNNETETPYFMANNTDIAWDSDKALYGQTKYRFDQVAPPPNWRKMFPTGYNETLPPPNIADWQAFMVWMRTAGLPTFSKLYQRNDSQAMEAGVYRVIINDNFPTTEYKGTKSIIISTRTVMGGRNPFLGIAYIVVGGICIVLGAIFTVTHLIKPRKLGDHTYLSWNNAPSSGKQSGPSTAIASGRETRPGEA